MSFASNASLVSTAGCFHCCAAVVCGTIGDANQTGAGLFRRALENRRENRQGLNMRNAFALIVAAALAIRAVTSVSPIHAGERWPAIPDETGARLSGHVEPLPFICGDGPVYNRYHDAHYDQPPAIYLGYAYRPYYRYTAWRIIPRTYFCPER
jgi:hypothetical protein